MVYATFSAALRVKQVPVVGTLVQSIAASYFYMIRRVKPIQLVTQLIEMVLGRNVHVAGRSHLLQLRLRILHE